MTNTNGHGERVALYCRVSTNEQSEHGFSIPEQKRDLLDHAERQGWAVVEIVADEGHSGAVGVRPGLDRIMQLAETGEIDLVLAKRRARLFRDRYLRIGYERSLLEHGVRLLALDDGGHRLADAVMDEFGDWWKEQIREATVAGRMEKARQGKVIGSKAPLFGFRFVKDERGKVVGYAVDEARMEIVRKIVETVASVGSINGTKRVLEPEGVPTPGGGPVWREITIRRTVMNDAYYPHTSEELGPLLEAAGSTARVDERTDHGIVWYPQTKVERLEPDPERGYARSIKESRYARQEQVPIPVPSSGIPRETIDAARLALRGNVRFRNTGDRVYELASLIRCADCGNRLATNRKSQDGIRYDYYRCSNCQRHGSAVCSMNKNFPAGALERKVLHAVLGAVKDRDELIRKANDRYERERNRLLRAGAADAAGWRRALDEIERQRVRAQRAYMEEVIGLEDLRARQSDLDAEKVHTERLLKEHEGREDRLRHLEAARDKAIRQIRRGEWAKLGITEPQARRERYREIGLTATAAVDGTVRLTWGLGQEAVVCTQDPASRGRFRARCLRPRCFWPPG